MTIDVAPYRVSLENVAVLKRYRGRTVQVRQFIATEAGKTEIICRGAVRITTPDKRSFEDYIRKAFVDELMAAELLSEPAPVTLSGGASKVDFSSSAGKWLLDYTVTSSNGRSLTVAEEYGYGSRSSSGPLAHGPQKLLSPRFKV